jgi:alkaline phosphatase
MKRIILILTLLFAASAIYAQQTPKNVILIIADGMGPAQAYASHTLARGKSQFLRFPYTGFSITYSASDYVTDSGAGGTAIACGVKTYNHAIGVDADTVEHKSILEISAEKGKKTGVIVTSTVSHATPASFLAHHFDRDDEEAIALDIFNSPVNLLIGGGEKYFTEREDEVNLAKKLKNNGNNVTLSNEYAANPNFFDKSYTPLNRNFIFTAHAKPGTASDRGDMLPKATKFGINLLDEAAGDDGFFMMIESSQIDWACHANRRIYLQNELKDLEKTIKEALDFAEADCNTLVIVTADHECGALSLKDGDMEKGEIDTDFDSFHHSGVWVPVFAVGPGAENFVGIMDNTDIFKKLNLLIK